MLCQTSRGFLCKDPYSSPTEISFTIQNQKMQPINLISVSLLRKDGSVVKVHNTSARLRNTHEARVIFSSDKFPKIVEGDLLIEYSNVYSGLELRDKGRIRFVT